MSENIKPFVLVNGGGPVGLSAATFLNQNGFRCRIVEKLLERSQFSKAIVINIRSLEFLEESGVTELFLKNGKKIEGANINNTSGPMVYINFNDFKSTRTYNYPIGQAQYETEQILEEHLKTKGVILERGLEVINVKNNENNVSCEFKNVTTGEITRGDYDYVFAADGAHSSTRKCFNLEFQGNAYEEPWTVIDIDLETDKDKNQMHVFLLDKTFLFMFPLKNDRWRLVGIEENLLDLLPKNTKVKSDINWQSNFRISYRVISKFSEGRVFFGGDAAHIHSPAGGRGMNLGIEDAYVFVRLLQEGRLDEYHNKRHGVVTQIVQQISNLTEVPRGLTWKAKFIRATAPYILPLIYRLFSQNILCFFLGLDHEI